MATKKKATKKKATKKMTKKKIPSVEEMKNQLLAEIRAVDQKDIDFPTMLPHVRSYWQGQKHAAERHLRWLNGGRL